MIGEKIEVESKERFCTTCKRFKGLNDFYLGVNGLKPECKDCKKDRNKKYYQEKKEAEKLEQKEVNKVRRGYCLDTLKEVEIGLEIGRVNWLKSLREHHEKKWGKKNKEIVISAG